MTFYQDSRGAFICSDYIFLPRNIFHGEYMTLSTMNYTCKYYICQTHSEGGMDTILNQPNGIDYLGDNQVVRSICCPRYGVSRVGLI